MISLNANQIIGIGSGSTVPYVVERIQAQGKDVNASRVFLPTGKPILVLYQLRYIANLIPVSFQDFSQEN